MEEKDGERYEETGFKVRCLLVYNMHNNLPRNLTFRYELINHYENLQVVSLKKKCKYMYKYLQKYTCACCA